MIQTNLCFFILKIDAFVNCLLINYVRQKILNFSPKINSLNLN